MVEEAVPGECSTPCQLTTCIVCPVRIAAVQMLKPHDFHDAPQAHRVIVEPACPTALLCEQRADSEWLATGRAAQVALCGEFDTLYS